MVARGKSRVNCGSRASGRGKREGGFCTSIGRITRAIIPPANFRDHRRAKPRRWPGLVGDGEASIEGCRCYFSEVNVCSAVSPFNRNPAARRSAPAAAAGCSDMDVSMLSSSPPRRKTFHLALPSEGGRRTNGTLSPSRHRASTIVLVFTSLCSEDPAPAASRR